MRRKKIKKSSFFLDLLKKMNIENLLFIVKIMDETINRQFYFKRNGICIDNQCFSC